MNEDTELEFNDKNDDVPDKKIKVKSEIIEWVKALLLYCVIPVAIFESFCFIASVPTGSMETTIPVGAQVLTTRCFDKDNIKRGDIVVFDSDELDKILIKRCIGLPGDTVVFDGNGNTFINGEYYEEPYVSTFSLYMGEFNVPDDCYLFCGDNRDGSYDSRFWNNPYIEKDKVKGIARFVILPFSSTGVLK